MRIFTATAVLATAAFACEGLAEEPAQNWPRFRGAHARGVADGHPTPTVWSVETGEGVAWKTPIPGLAHSSPVVWGDSVFLTSAVNEKGDPS